MSSASRRNSDLSQSKPIWSKSGKAGARTAFDAALDRELHAVANVIQESGDLWSMEHMTEGHKEIDHN